MAVLLDWDFLDGLFDEDFLLWGSAGGGTCSLFCFFPTFSKPSNSVSDIFKGAEEEQGSSSLYNCGSSLRISSSWILLHCSENRITDYIFSPAPLFIPPICPSFMAYIIWFWHSEGNLWNFHSKSYKKQSVATER